MQSLLVSVFTCAIFTVFGDITKHRNMSDLSWFMQMYGFIVLILKLVRL